MSRIPQSFIDDLLSRIDIVSVIDSRVKLKRTGKNYAACCPFHDEKTPSFSVSPDKQFYYCFGCGATGNALGFVMEYERHGFIDAVESLAKTAGLEVPREQASDRDRQQSLKRKKLYESLEKASEFYQQQLRHHSLKQQAVQYLQGRGLTGIIARDFGIGFAPPGYDNLLKALGENEENIKTLIDAGLVIEREDNKRRYDRFRHRITFPIRDSRGRVIGFGGRVLGNDKPKYLNSPETEVFHKGTELYGLYEAMQNNRQLESLLVVEGYMDVIALAQFEINNAVATLGTACGEDHLKLAFRQVQEVVFCFDGDNAGRTAAKRALMNALSSMEDGRQIKFLFLPEGQDPDSMVRQIGKDRFLAQTKNAVPLEEFLFDVAAEGIDINSMDGRARFSKLAAPLIAQLPTGIFKELMYGNLAKRTGLSREVLNELQPEELIIEPQPSKQESTVDKPVDEEIAEFAPQIDAPPLNGPLEQVADDAVDFEYSQLSEENPSFDNRQPVQKQLKASKSSQVDLSPAKIATILLLESPELLSKIENIPELSDFEDGDCKRLNEIITYLKKRPKSNFNNILGYWGGAKGIQEQQSLAKLVANHFLSSASALSNYDSLQEFANAINCLNNDQIRQKNLLELQSLKARKLSELSDTEKQRLIELTKH